jgi:hypothetical protein
MNDQPKDKLKATAGVMGTTAPTTIGLASIPPDSVGGFSSLLVFVVLGLAWFVGFASRLFAIVRFESIIHEFDPWYSINNFNF